MKYKHYIFAVSAFIIIFSLSASVLAGDDNSDFNKLRSQKWIEVFSDSCTGNWKEKWFLDGMKAKVSNDDKAMTIDTIDKGFAVLWTKQSFEGDLRIEYDFKRVDEKKPEVKTTGVNIIYIQATGDGQKECVEDIAKWSEHRKLAKMRNYFQNMHTYHISYATDKSDYIRGRRYLPLSTKNLHGTGLSGEYHNVGLFADKKWIHITIIKRPKELWMELKHPEKTLLCHFKNNNKPAIEKGRIGLRLMAGRMSQFKNFRVMSNGITPTSARKKEKEKRVTTEKAD